MNKPVQVDTFVIRHARQNFEAHDDPGIDEQFADKIEDTALYIRQALGEEGQVTVYTSPLRRAYETGERLLSSPHLNNSLQPMPEVSQRLGIGTFLSETFRERDNRWVLTLNQMAKLAIAQTSEDGRPGLILVTHEPVLHIMPQLRMHKTLNTSNLGVNRFTTKLLDAPSRR